MKLTDWVADNLPANAEFDGISCVTFRYKGAIIAQVRDIYGIRFDPAHAAFYVHDKCWSVLAQAMEFANKMDDACGLYADE